MFVITKSVTGKKALIELCGIESSITEVGKAPEAKIAEEKAKLEKYTGMLATVEERLGQLKK